jgi:hypothetical protein
MFPRADTTHAPILGIECIRIGRYDGDMWGAVCLRSFKQRVRRIITPDSGRMCVRFFEYQSVFSVFATHAHQLHCSVASAAGLAATCIGTAPNSTLNDDTRSPEPASVVADDGMTRLMIKTCR